MKRIEIQLSKPFNEVLASVLRLPPTLAEIDVLPFAGGTDLEGYQSPRCDLEVKEALRSLYEAAHGRQIETPIDFLPNPAPVAGFLKANPYYVATQHEFFLEALTRILVAESTRKSQTNRSGTPGSRRATNRGGVNGSSSHPRRVNRNVFLAPPPSRFAGNQQLNAHN